MKKTLWMLGVAVAALTSCTESDVLDVPESRVIGFDPFVDTQTRAITDMGRKTMNMFWAFGYKKPSGEGSYNTAQEANIVFKNDLVSGVIGETTTIWTCSRAEYWSTNSDYRFAAYSDGNEKIETTNAVTYNPNTDILTFTDYVANDHKDLVAAISDVREVGNMLDGNAVSSVSLIFKHMLSKVQFSFTSTANVTIKISELKIDAVNKGTGTLAYSDGNTTIDWTPSTLDSDKGYQSVTVLIPTMTSGEALENFAVIPQSNSTLNVSFKMTSYDTEGHFINERDKTVSLSSQVHEGQWKAGYVYNYHAAFGDDFDEVPITFTVYGYPSWEAASNSGTTIVQ